MIQIHAVQGDRREILTAAPGENLLDLLRRSDFGVPAVCGGQGTCGKCLVRLRRNGREETLLACSISFPDDSEDCSVELPEQSGPTVPEPEAGSLFSGTAGTGPSDSPVCAAVDLGTTTVAVRLIGGEGDSLPGIVRWNRQGAYGADVITRIQYILDHPDGLERLSGLIRDQIRSMCEELLGPGKRLDHLFLAGNTVMQHIAAKISPAGIAFAPFRPETLFDDGRTWSFDGIPVHFSPCVSGYIGGDITSGLTASGILEQPGCRLFLDIGTNGEMALIRNGKAIACSVASGPAFEGGGIRCGMPGGSGAIRKAAWNGTAWDLDVIDRETPEGICGSGLLDLAAELIRNRIVSGTGRLLPPEELPAAWSSCMTEDENGNGLLHLGGEVVLTAADIRQLQLAKAAVAAGIEILMRHQKVTASEIDEVLLAGGFGSALNPQSAAAIGMIPAELAGKTRPVGNAALQGMTDAAGRFRSGKDRHADPEEAMLSAILPVRNACRYLELSAMPEFNNEYIDQMSFYDEEDEEWN